MAASLAFTGPLLSLMVILGAPQAPQAGTQDLIELPGREQIQQILFRIQNHRDEFSAVREKLAQDALTASQIPAAEGFPFLKDANQDTLAQFPNMPLGFRVALESGQHVLTGMEPAQGRAILLHTNFVLADEENRLTGEGFPLLRALLVHYRERGRLNMLNVDERLAAMVASVEDLTARAYLFTEAQQSLSLTAALKARPGVQTSFLARELFLAVMTAVLGTEECSTSLFYKAALWGGDLHLVPSALAVLKTFAQVGKASCDLPEDHRALLGQALDQAEAAAPEVAKQILRDAFTTLGGAR